MHLINYLSSKQVNRQDFASQIGVTSMAVGRYMRGERVPTPDIMGKIFAATKGMVTANDFYDLPLVASSKSRRGRKKVKN